jgi:hypothetical protein
MLRLPRDYYVRLDANGYSCTRRRSAAAWRSVPTSSGSWWSARAVVAEHARCWARHQTITDPAHGQAAARLRHQRARLAEIGRRDPGEVELRRLADDDAAFGLDDAKAEGVA